MAKEQIKFRPLAGYKYQLMQDYRYVVPVGYLLYGGGRFQSTDGWVVFDITMDSRRSLTIRKGYAWDGPSGPTYDTSNFMRGSLVHDALYQLFRQSPAFGDYRDDADKLLQKIIIEDGMSRWRVALVYWGVKTWGKRSATSTEREFGGGDKS